MPKKFCYINFGMMQHIISIFEIFEQNVLSYFYPFLFILIQNMYKFWINYMGLTCNYKK